jgi:hypothetical protein
VWLSNTAEKIFDQTVYYACMAFRPIAIKHRKIGSNKQFIHFPFVPNLEYRAPFRGFCDHTYMTHGRTPLDEWSARRRGLYLHRTTKHIDTETNINTPREIRNRDPSNRATFALRCVYTEDMYRTSIEHLFGTFCSGQIYDFCFIQVGGGAFTFRNNWILDMASDDHLMSVCSTACVAICWDEKEKGTNVFNETGYPRCLPVNSKWAEDWVRIAKVSEILCACVYLILKIYLNWWHLS